MKWTGMTAALCVAMLALTAMPAAAQGDPKVVVTGGLDITNQYNFRGIRQNTSGAAFWPWVDVGIPAASGKGALKAVTLNLGIWNSINSEGAPTWASPALQAEDKKWYETDYYATLGLGFSKATLGFTYTSYTSPNDYFAHVKELAVKLTGDDSGALGKGALHPYGLVAFELDDSGQADAGASKGTYVELGVAPGYSGKKASIAIPIKVGLSAKDYYEFNSGDDGKFGYFSIAGIVTVPIDSHWNVHGGGELQTYGDRLRTANNFGGDAKRAHGIASIGIGFSY